MNFIEPQYLYLLPAALIPLIIYLIFKKKPSSLVFSSLFLLKNISKRTNRISRLKDIILLIIRTLFIISLILFFAKPFTGGKKDIDPSKRTVTASYLDSSPSMSDRFRGYNKLESAKKHLLNTLELLPERSIVHILTSDPAVRYSGNKKDASEFISAVKPYGADRNINGVINALDSIVASAGDANYIELIFSDLYSKTDTDDTKLSATEDIPALRYALMMRNDERKDTSIDSVKISGRDILYAYVSLPDGSETTVDIYAKGSRIHSAEINGRDSKNPVSIPLEGITSEEVPVKLKLKDNFNPQNDSFYLVIPEVGKKKILVTGDPASDKVRDIKALIRSGVDSLIEITTVKAEMINSIPFNDKDMILISEMRSLDAYTTGRLDNYISAGGSVFFIMGPDLNINDYTSNLIPEVGLPRITGRKELGDSFIGINITAPSHPIFRNVFSENPEVNSVEIHDIFSVDPAGWDVILKAGKYPLLAEKKRNSGNLFLLTCGLEYESSNIMRNGFALPLLFNSIVHLTGSSLDRELSYNCGEQISLGSVSYLIPPGKELRKGSDELSSVFYLKESGFNRIFDTSGNLKYHIAVNSEREAINDVSELVGSEFEVLTIGDGQEMSGPVITFRKIDISIWFLYLCIVFIISEILIIRLM